MTPSLLCMLPEDLVAAAQAEGVECEPGEARRLLAHILSDGREDFALKKPVRRELKAWVQTRTRSTIGGSAQRVRDDEDGFEKLLLSLEDGAVVEAVRIPLHKEGAYTVCLSSQVGCAMGCAFCATGRLGLSRNLRADEIVGCFMRVRETLAQGERITGAVFMGQGEPLHNYDEVIRAARVLSHPCGGRVDARNISISTVGLVPAIHRYAREGHKFRLIVSLTSAIAERRRSLLPVAGKFTLEEVAGALRALHASHGDRLTIAWVVLGGVNTGDDEVAALRALLGELPLRINLIDVNDARPVSEGGFVRASAAELSAFLDRLSVLRAPIVRRYSGGRNKHAACGMLASTRQAPA
jgi:23S rRNA (adenine2503-C2)-methyltransferase